MRHMTYATPPPLFRTAILTVAVSAALGTTCAHAGLLNDQLKDFAADETVVTDAQFKQYSSTYGAGLAVIDGKTHTVTIAPGATLTLQSPETSGQNRIGGVFVGVNGSSLTINGNTTTIVKGTGKQQAFGLRTSEGTLNVNGTTTVNAAGQNEQGIGLLAFDGSAMNISGDLLDITASSQTTYAQGFQALGTLTVNSDRTVIKVSSGSTVSNNIARGGLSSGAEGKVKFAGDVEVNAVTTGKAWAKGFEAVNAGTLTFDKNLSITADSAAGAAGFHNSKGFITVNGDAVISVKAGSVEASGIKAETSGVTVFNGNADISVEQTGAGTSNEAYGVSVVRDPGDARHAVEFHGQNSRITAKAKDFAIGVKASGSDVLFDGEKAVITAESGDWAEGILAMNDANVTLNAATDISVKGKQAIGIYNFTYGTASKSSFGTVTSTKDLNITVTGDNAYGARVVTNSQSPATTDIADTGIFLDG